MKGGWAVTQQNQFYLRKGLWRTNSLKVTKHLKLLEVKVAKNVRGKEIAVYYTLP